MQVRETGPLGSPEESLVPLLERRGLDLLVHLNDVLELEEEPSVDLGQVVQLLDIVAEVQHRVGDGEESPVVVLRQGGVHVLRLPVGVETCKVGVNLSDGLLQRLLESSADGHDLSNGLHGRSDVSLNVLELGQIPLGDLGDNVVEGRLEASSGGLGDRVGKLGQGVAKSDLGGGVGKRVSGGLGGEGAGRQWAVSVSMRCTHEDRDRRAFISMTR